MTQQAKLQNEKEVSSKYSSSDSGNFWQNPVKSNYNSKYIYLSKDTDLDNSAIIKTNKSNNRCTDHVVNPKKQKQNISILLHADRCWRAEE